MIYFDEPFLTLSLEDGYIKGQWRGFFGGAEFRGGLERLLEIAVETNSTLYLADISRAKVIPLADQNWLISDWTPRAYEVGLRKIAFIVPTDVITQMAMNRVNRMIAKETVEVNHFDNEVEAINWLKSA